ncbi:hypothetical protein [Cerasibacillus terrae]|uniref:hypothetical protein n=1 Tax=Cerasibacillus terrae TaxID=2498845 RepID=UPI001E3084B9|nr:hypothetical protein [Cerasibacillus terrae]
MLKLIGANHVSEQQLDQFLESVTSISKEALLKEGYVIIVDEEIKGCFTLLSLTEEVFWLKQLYIQPEIANNLLALIETILLMIKNMKAKKLYVHSHQPVLDIILDALQFEKAKEEVQVEQKPNLVGKWWEYDVS